MLERVAVRPESEGFERLLELYCEAFSPEERYTDEEFEHLKSCDAVEFDIYCDGEAVIGFTMCICLPSYRYLVFLATDSRIRSKGYGAQILKILAERGKPIVLDIDPVDESAQDNEWRVRRLGFYERNGYALTGKKLVEPSGIEYDIMCNGAFDAGVFEGQCRAVIAEVYEFKVV